MDNFAFNMVSVGNERLLAAMRLALSSHPTISGYIIRAAHDAFTHEEHRHLDKPARPDRLIFLWSGYEKADDYVAFPFAMDADGCADFARRWLETADYGEEPDHDGHNKKGWRLYNEAWGHVEEIRSAAIAVAPAWAMYGK